MIKSIKSIKSIKPVKPIKSIRVVQAIQKTPALLAPLAALALALAAASPAQDGEAPPPDVTLARLLEEVADRGSAASWPDPEWTLVPTVTSLASPDVVTIDHAGRTEYVLLDAAGPGAVTSIRCTETPGTFRVYLDGSDIPALAADMTMLFGGDGPLPSPIATYDGSIATSRIPIPFEARCVITTDVPGDLVATIEHRIYPTGTSVQSYARTPLAERRRLIDAANDRLRSAPPVETMHRSRASATIAPGSSLVLMDVRDAAIFRSVEMMVGADDADAAALAGLVLRGTFDGERTIECAATDIFDEPDAEGIRRCTLPMPFAFGGRLELVNTSGVDATITAVVGMDSAPWLEDSLLLHARSVAAPGAPATTLTVEGAGRFAGGPYRRHVTVRADDAAIARVPSTARPAATESILFRSRLEVTAAAESIGLVVFYARPGAKVEVTSRAGVVDEVEDEDEDEDG